MAFVLRCVPFLYNSKKIMLVSTTMKGKYYTSKMNTHTVAVIGSGLMGSGIAQLAAQTGHNVTMMDVSDDLLKKSLSNIQISMQRVAKKKFDGKPEDQKKFIQDSLNRLKTVTSIEEAVKNAEIVVEAIVENIKIKHEVFKAVDAAAPKSAIFASNTSSLSIKEIASVTKRLDRFGGLHFFNPVAVMKLVEVIRTSDTSDETYKLLTEFGKRLGKVTVSCKDTPGFIVNRLLIPYFADAFQMFERGDASFQDIDTAMKLGAGYPMGPFELQDYTGLDLAKDIMEGWAKKFPNDSRLKNLETVNKMVAKGKLGRKSGEGFYKYDKK